AWPARDRRDDRRARRRGGRDPRRARCRRSAGGHDRAVLLRQRPLPREPQLAGRRGDLLRGQLEGRARGDAKRYNPGFHRDGDTRFEATVRVDTTRATGPDVVALLERALTYLTERV